MACENVFVFLFFVFVFQGGDASHKNTNSRRETSEPKLTPWTGLD